MWGEPCVVFEVVKDNMVMYCMLYDVVCDMCNMSVSVQEEPNTIHILCCCQMTLNNRDYSVTDMLKLL